MAAYSDYQLQTPNKSDMDFAIKALGFEAGEGSRKGIRFQVNVYGIKYVPTGNTVLDPWGLPVPEMAPAPGYFAILRWLSDTPFPPPDVNVPPRLTIGPIPADSPHRFAEV